MLFGYLEKLFRDEKIFGGRGDNLTTDSKCEILLHTQCMWLITTLQKSDRQYLVDNKAFWVHKEGLCREMNIETAKAKLVSLYHFDVPPFPR